MSNYPDNMSSFNSDRDSPNYSPIKKIYEKEYEPEDWDDMTRDEISDREDDDDYNRDEPARF